MSAGLICDACGRALKVGRIGGHDAEAESLLWIQVGQRGHSLKDACTVACATQLLAEVERDVNEFGQALLAAGDEEVDDA